MDGDGWPDPVTLQQVSEDTMLLRVGLPEEFVDAQVPGNAGGALNPSQLTSTATGGWPEVLVSGRVLDSLNAYQADSGGYQGNRVNYQFAFGVGSEVYNTPIKDADRDNLVLQADPATCAPL